MKTLKILLLFPFLVFIVSCSDDDTVNMPNELQGLTLVREMSNETHLVELYTEAGTIQQGHNRISVRIKDKTSGHYLQDAMISWLPLMHMSSMQHSCPFSSVTKTIGKESLFSGTIVFQMAENATEYWTLKIDYSIDGSAFSVSDTISVPASAKRRVSSFMGSDGNNYVVALIDPSDPSVALNDMTAGLYKMESMMNYQTADNYTIKIDPRMPGMGNHGSPNNIDLAQQADGLYSGKLSLTMTGYWRINLQVLNIAGEIIKGEPVTDQNPQSSLYFEIEF